MNETYVNKTGQNSLFSTAVLVVCTIGCVISILFYIHISFLLDIQRIDLKKGAFPLKDNTYEFDFVSPSNDKYNAILRFYHQRNQDFINRSAEDKINFTINAELITLDGDVYDKLIRSANLDQNSDIPGGGSQDYFEWYILSSYLNKGEKYRLRITFRSDEVFFTKMTKEIYIEEDYDIPSAVWWHLFRMVFLIIFVITLIIILIISISRLKRRYKRVYK